MHIYLKINSIKRGLYYLVFSLFFFVAFNPDLTNNFFLWHGVQLLIVLTCCLNIRVLQMTFYTKWFLAYYSFLFLSCFWATNPVQALTGVFYFLLIHIPLFAMYCWIHDKSDLLLCIVSFITGLVINCFYILNTAGLFSQIGVLTPGLHYWASNATSRRYALGCILIGAMIKLAKGRIEKLLYVLMMIPCAYVLLFCTSRGAFLIVALSIFVAILFSKENQFKKIGLFLLLIGLIVFLYYFIMNNQYIYPLFGRKLEKFFNAAAQKGVLGAEEDRVERIIDGFKVFLNRPLFGYGYNGFANNTRFTAYSHNDYIETLCDIGMVGFSIYYSIFLFIARFMPPAVKKEKTGGYSLIFGIVVALFAFNVLSVVRYDISIQACLCFACVIVEQNWLSKRYGEEEGKDVS